MLVDSLQRDRYLHANDRSRYVPGFPPGLFFLIVGNFLNLHESPRHFALCRFASSREKHR